MSHSIISRPVHLTEGRHVHHLLQLLLTTAGPAAGVPPNLDRLIILIVSLQLQNKPHLHGEHEAGEPVIVPDVDTDPGLTQQEAHYLHVT